MCCNTPGSDLVASPRNKRGDINCRDLGSIKLAANNAYISWTALACPKPFVVPSPRCAHRRSETMTTSRRCPARPSTASWAPFTSTTPARRRRPTSHSLARTWDSHGVGRETMPTRGTAVNVVSEHGVNDQRRGRATVVFGMSGVRCPTNTGFYSAF